MSGALDRLVRRVRGTLQTVEPVLPSRWEQHPEQTGLRETHTEATEGEATAEPVVRTAPPAFTPAPPRPAVAERARPAGRVVQEKVAGAEPQPDTGEGRQPGAQLGVAVSASVAAPAWFDPISVASTPPAPTRHEEANPDRPFRPIVPEAGPAQPTPQRSPIHRTTPLDVPLSQTGDDRRPALRWRAPARGAVPAGDGSAAQPDAPSLQPQDNDRLASRSHPPTPTAPEPNKLQPAAEVQAEAGEDKGLPRGETPAPMRPPPEPYPQTPVRSQARQPDVHVTIARVEVHPPRRAPEPLPAQVAIRPRISLEEYQRQRRDRGR